MKKTILILACLLAFVSAGYAQTFTLTLDAGQLRGPLGTTAEPVGGLLQLIASPSGTFTAPTTASYVSGDNVLVASFAMNNTGGTAETVNPLGSLMLATGSYTLTAGEQLELRFYPSLTFAAKPAAPTLGTSFGQVRSNTIEFGSAGGDPSETPWVVPSPGSTVHFDYVTVSNFSGGYANATAYADNVVIAVPEPSTNAMLGGGFFGLLGLMAWRRRAGLVASA